MIQVIIPNYNNARDTLECLGRLDGYHPGVLETLVVDNGSRDGSVPELRAARPGLSIIEAPKNLGYAAGCNLGIEATIKKHPDYFLFLNNDATIGPDALNRLLETGRIPDIGILGPIILTCSPGKIIESFGMRCRWRTGRFYHLHFGHSLESLEASVLSRASIEADALSGSALLVKKEVIETVGGFHQDYFCYFEDTDLCRRAQKAGFRTVLVPGATAVHKGSSTIMEIDPALRIYYGARNQLLLFNRNEPIPDPLSRTFRNFNIISLNLAYALFRSELPKAPALRMWRRGVTDYYRGSFGKYPEAKPGRNNG